MNVLQSTIENFTSPLDAEALVWIIFVIVNFLILTRTHLLLVILRWTPLFLTICFFVFRNGINGGLKREAFFHNLSIGQDISSMNSTSEESLKTLRAALETYNVVLFDVGGPENCEHEDNFVMNDRANSTTESNHYLLFEEMMDECRKKNARVVLNVLGKTSEFISLIINYVNKYNIHSRVVVTSVHPIVPFLVKKNDYKMLTGLSFSTNDFTSRFERSQSESRILQYVGYYLDKFISLMVHSFILPRFIGADILFMDREDFSVNFVASAESKNIKVVALSVNSVIEKNWMSEFVKIPFFTKKGPINTES